jgi:hypothetical protein
MQRVPIVSLLFFAVGCTPLLHANDTAVTLGAGGLIATKTNQIAMESEDLEISVDKITVRYVFRNTTDKDVEMLVAFPLPDLDGRLLYLEPVNLPDEKHLNFVNFSVTSDGRPVQVSMDSRAFSGEKDVTPLLKSAGISANLLTEPLNKSLLKIPDAERRRLEKEQLIVESDFSPPLPGIGKKGWWGNWAMRVNFYWKQHFPANGTVELIQTYKPVVGGSYIVGSDDGKSSVERYCGNLKTLQQIAEVKSLHPVKDSDDVALWERTIDYILKTANNWKAPIGRFRLVARLNSPDDILATCMPGLRQVDSTHFEIIRTQFSPTEDIKLLILEPATTLPALPVH